MSIRSQLHDHLVAALHAFVQDAGLTGVALPRVALVPPKNDAHGDYSSPIALGLARLVKQNPRNVAAALQALLGDMNGLLERIDIAGPGHLNFFVRDQAFLRSLHHVLTDNHAGMQHPKQTSRPILLEYVSANPTGPLHVAHGRGAVHGDVLARLLKLAGYDVEREYYVNDLGRQTDVMAESIFLRYGELLGQAFVAPQDFYPGSYITDIAQEALQAHGKALLTAPKEQWLPILRTLGIEQMLRRIRQDLTSFNIDFDHWVSEASICLPETLQNVVARLRQAGHIFEEDGKVWFRSTTFGDDKDRVVLRDDGRPTYFLTDLAYHDQKAQRGFARLINIWGADHGGYVARVRAGLQALGHDGAMLEVLLIQMVSLSQKGEAVRMGKRLGTAVWLDEVVAQAGSDATRYLFSMRRIDAQMDFDIDLAMRRSIENPVYYAQMGHARLAAIARRAQDTGVPAPEANAQALQHLTLPEEQQMLRTLARAADVIEDAAQALEPHQVVHYMQALIAQFHSYYTRYKNTHKVVSSDAATTTARLLMCRGLQRTLHGLLTALGVSAPLAMHLDDVPAQDAEDAPATP